LTSQGRPIELFHFWCPVPVKVQTDTQAYRETYRALTSHLCRYVI
jgi:hypothetical protein